MSTEPILSINRCFEEMAPCATKEAECTINLSSDEHAPEILLPGQHVLKLHDRMPTLKTMFPEGWMQKFQL